MDKKQIVQRIEKFAPLSLAETWDCSGWVSETEKTDIRRVMLCLTVTDDIIRQAKDKNCDMIISHHPLFFVPFGYEDIDIYCAHTNLDRTQGGTTDILVDSIINNCQKTCTDDGFVRIAELKEPVKISDFVNKLKFISPNLRYVNNKNIDTIQRIAFCAGSGSEFIDDIDCDAYVTGDLKFHRAVESGKVLFDLGHFESEILVLKVFENLLKDLVEVIYAEEKSPFIY